MSNYLGTSTTLSMSKTIGKVEDPVAPLIRFFSDIHWQDYCGSDSSKHPFSKKIERKYVDGIADSCTATKYKKIICERLVVHWVVERNQRSATMKRW